MTKIKPLYFRLASVTLIVVGVTWLAHLNRPQAVNLANVSVRMSNSRLSFRGQVDGTPGANTTITIDLDDTIGDYTEGTSDTLISDALKINDVLTFTGGTAGTRTVRDIIDGETIIINATIATTDEKFYLRETTDLVATFNTVSAIAGSTNTRFELILPAATSNYEDGVPDQGFFDFGTSAPTVSCAGTGYTFGTGTATAGRTNSDTGFENLPAGTWHVYRCPYSASAAPPTTITMTIGSGDDDAVINPVRVKAGSPANQLETGQADTYSAIVRNIDNAHAVVDSTTVKIGVLEAVRVSATVVPSITFEIYGYTATTGNRCGQTIHIDTTAASVPFGEIATATFTNGAQRLVLKTNALSGGVVTAVANDQLGREGSTCTDKLTPVYAIDPASNEHLCIWDANISGMTQSTTQAWTTITGSTGTGFGYSIENIDSAAPAFTHGGGTDFDARHFADAEFDQDPVTIFGSNSLPTNSDSVYICYRIAADALTAAGDYYNYITYTATATF